MKRLCVRGGRCGDGPLGPSCPWAGSLSQGPWRVAELEAPGCVFQKLPRCAVKGSSLSGHRDVGVTPVPGTSREEAREKACAEKFARRQVGGGAVIMGKVSLLPSTLDTRPGHPVWGCPPGHHACGAAFPAPAPSMLDAVPREKD